MTVIGTNFGGSRRSRVSWAVELARAAHINLVVESIDANVAEDLRHMGWECVSNMWGGPAVAWRPEHFDLVRQRWFQTPGRRGGWGSLRASGETQMEETFKQAGLDCGMCTRPP